MRKTLIIVDPQYDFIEGGSLPVTGGTSALNNIVKFIDSHKEIERIIITKDWHEYDHCSFKEFGGQFPEHCVAGTKGANIYKSILDIIGKNKIYTEFIHKGMTKENFSGFLDVANTYRDYIEVNTTDNFTVFFSVYEEIIICGLAGDICVLNTLKALDNLPIDKSVFIEGIASLDGGHTLNKYIVQHEINIYFG